MAWHAHIGSGAVAGVAATATLVAALVAPHDRPAEAAAPKRCAIAKATTVFRAGAVRVEITP